MQIKDELIILLGVNGDLGKSLAQKLLAQNKKVIGIDIHTRPRIKLDRYFQCDLANFSLVKKVVAQIKFNNQQTPIIISCIGLFNAPTYENDCFVTRRFLQSVNVNLLGVTIFINQLLTKFLRLNLQSMRVIVVGSTAAHVGSLDLGYGLAKAGLNGLVRSLSKALAARGVVCIGVTPGIFTSRMSRSVARSRQARAIAATQIKRIGELEEVVNLLDYVALEAPAYLTGSIIPLNGGQYT